ncbi:MAG: zinc ribbon domain-containing protein [Betaproteobacteria bacterium]|nr:MAG: zinc ribbon domain-containing protein [Betaproteobacteria bacterium]
MGFFERMLDNLTRGGFGGHHGGYRGSHGGDRHGSRHGVPQDGGRGVPQGDPPETGNVCPKCGSTNSVQARFCQQCGTSLQREKCSGCGAELAANARFCGQCGKPRP